MSQRPRCPKATPRIFSSFIAHLKARGVGLIYVSHRMQEILRLADRVSVLRDGALVGTRPAAELDNKTIVRMMVGRSLGEVMKRSNDMRRRNRPEGHRTDVGQGARTSTSPCTEGEVVGLAGLIGAGRTELGKTIFGAFRHDEGEIEVEGRRSGSEGPRTPSMRASPTLRKNERPMRFFPNLGQ